MDPIMGHFQLLFFNDMSNSQEMNLQILLKVQISKGWTLRNYRLYGITHQIKLVTFFQGLNAEPKKMHLMTCNISYIP